VHDLLRWDAALRDGRLVEPETLQRAYTPVRLADGSTKPYGYGWQIAQTPDGRVVHHGGGLAGYRTSIVRNLDNGTTLVLLTNHGDNTMIGQITAAAGAILKGDEPPLPAVPIQIPLRRWIEAEGVAAALDRYDALRADRPRDYRWDEELLNQLGYEYLAAERVDVATAVFEKNVEAYPGSANVYDSLGEALMVAGDTEAAIANYERSLQLDPDNENAVGVLEQLRAR
jgi:CubicO group peptidase (beta-lactamase class C family)